MATNLDINSSLIERARSVGRKKTKKAAVEEALNEYIQRRKQMEILELFHTIDFDPAWDYKRQRKIK
ncbi:MAG: type II toxin-antitoxin system VapB family antitoxin [Fibrobacterota bacterium]